MLYSPTLAAIIDKTPIISKFKGIFAADEVPRLNSDGSLIVNTQPINSPGEHWIAVHVDRGRTKVFDSFGRPPPSFIVEKSDFEVSFSPHFIQHLLSSNCGLYCVAFLAASNAGKLNQFFELFSGDPDENEEILADLFR